MSKNIIIGEFRNVGLTLASIYLSFSIKFLSIFTEP